MFESYLKPPISFPTLTGSIVTFNSQYALPLKSHKIALTATQSGSGTPSPDNVRPISGHSAINISQSGADTSNPTVHTITIGSTVYGGTYDAITGILTVTHMLVNLDMNWTLVSGTPNLFQSDVISGFVLPANNYGVFEGLCNVYEVDDVASVNEQTNVSLGVTYTGRVRVYDTSYTSATDFYNYIKDKQLLGKLATPTTIQLSPAQILTLMGQNNIWADTGNTTLQYIKLG